ncbi:MAG: FtsQ-type POTRA domain-containing protein, partial [Candidatus Omnitrophica bacterium]|nr:FtsQ-type POTRA domain-containing protein [Candidatus Omnitrophota bacterium]
MAEKNNKYLSKLKADRRNRRMRSFKLIGIFILIIFVPTSVFLLKKLALKYIHGLETFTIREVVITPLQYDDLVKEILERQPTKNLVFLDVTRLYTDLMALPGVERVTLRKILPNRLKVVLNQRSPWVRIIAAEEYYIDKEGWVVVAPDRSPELTVKGLIVENNRVQPSEAFKLIIIQELEKWYNYYQVSS